MSTDPTYVAAWPDHYSRTLLSVAGVTKRVHLTTCFDKSGRLAEVDPALSTFAAQARVMALEEWTTGKGRLVVALLDECPWAYQINAFYRAAGLGDKRAYRPHLTLAKNVQPGSAKQFQFLVGYHLKFDRHGFE